MTDKLSSLLPELGILRAIMTESTPITDTITALADEVNAIRAENERLREALEKISQQNPAPDPYGSGQVARAALGEK